MALLNTHMTISSLAIWARWEKKNDADKHKSISKRYVNYVKVTPSQITNQEENETFVDYRRKHFAQFNGRSFQIRT